MSTKRIRMEILVPVVSVIVLGISIGMATYFNRNVAVIDGDGGSINGGASNYMKNVANFKSDRPGGLIRCTEDYYLSLVRDKSSEYQVPEPTLDEMRSPLSGGVEFHGEKMLDGKNGFIETRNLRVSVAVEKIGELGNGHGFRAEHIVLVINNKTDASMAYRVDTVVGTGARCGGKIDISHNAIVIAPREVIRRSECLYNPRLKVYVRHIEVYEVTFLGHRFLSRLAPTVGSPFDMRVAAGHTFATLRPCRAMPWRYLEGGGDWHSIIDFYARHDCDEYSFPRGYKFFKNSQQLPICAEIGGL